MKTLLIFRHAKSDWNAAFRYDHDRPLSQRGIGAAGVMGAWLATKGPLPDTIVCSTARRTRQTLELASRAGSWEAPVHFSAALYGASLSDVLDLVRSESEKTRTLMLIGHEPTSSEVIGRFADQLAPRFPTAAMARIDFEITQWRKARWAGGRLIWLQRPKELPAQ